MPRPFAIALAAALLTGGVARGEELTIQGNVEGAKQPQLAVSRSGKVYAVFGSPAGIFCAASPDGGKKFGEPVKVAEPKPLSLGARRGPRLAATEKALCVTAECIDGDVHAWRSQDEGKTWEGPVKVSDAKGSAKEGFNALAAGEGETVACAWLDLRNGKTELWAAVSEDGGAKWGKNVLAYQAPEGSICECCHCAIATDGKKDVAILFRNSVQGARDMFVVRSRDGGKSFGTALKLGAATWELDRCPMAGGAIAYAPDGNVYAAWVREASLFLTTPKEQRALGEGKEPWVAVGPDGAHVVWRAKTGDVVWLAPGARPVKLAPGSAPVVAAGPGGKGPVVAAFEGEKGKVFVRVLR